MSNRNRAPGAFYKSKRFRCCHKCGKRTMWRRYTLGACIHKSGNRSVAVILVPYCKSHDLVKKRAKK